MKNIEKADRIHLEKLISEIKDGYYEIPDFQRDFEWEPSDVTDLIRSIFMDYYIGTLLLWKANNQNLKNLSCEPIKGYTGNGKPYHIILDGQQRLTAMFFAFFNPDIPYPRRKSRSYFLAKIIELLDENFEKAFFYQWETNKFRKLRVTPELQYQENIFPLEIVGKGSWEIMLWIQGYESFWRNQLENYPENPPDEATKEEIKEFHKQKKLTQRCANNAPELLRNLFKELLSEYYISYIELDSEITIAKVCDIFARINSKGVVLSIFDLLNAILRPHDIFLKEMWRKDEYELSFIDSHKMRIYVLQVISILLQTYCSPKYLYYLVPGATKTIKLEDGSKSDIILIQTKEEFIEKWKEAIVALRKTISKMQNPRDYGAIKTSFIPYPSIVPALTAIRKHVEDSDYKNVSDINAKIDKWYWASIFTQNYSSSVESTAAKDFVDLQKWFSDDDDVPDIYVKFKADLGRQEFRRIYSKGSAIYNAIFNILIKNEARDWNTFELPEYESLDDHHIVPHSWGKEIIGDDINSILNRTPLSPDTNRNIIRDRLPNEYMKQMLDDNDETKIYSVLASHLISHKAVNILLHDPFTREDYYSFIEERERTIKAYIRNNIILENITLPGDLKELDEEIDALEKKLRHALAMTLGEDGYKEYVPPHTMDKVKKRIQDKLKKEPAFSHDDFRSVRKKLDFFDMQEYCDVIVSKPAWHLFEVQYKDKTQVLQKFNQLSDLRNGIRHSRDVSDITILEGRAAIIWLNDALKD